MWAEWMKDYDLSVTKEDIEKYEKMKKEKQKEMRRLKWHPYLILITKHLKKKI